LLEQVRFNVAFYQCKLDLALVVCFDGQVTCNQVFFQRDAGFDPHVFVNHSAPLNDGVRADNNFVADETVIKFRAVLDLRSIPDNAVYNLTFISNLAVVSYS
jgi:hypothetical protein